MIADRTQTPTREERTSLANAKQRASDDAFRSNAVTRSGTWASASLLGLLLAIGPDAASAAPVDAPRAWTLAYIDPGTGSFLVQAVVAAVAGIAVTSRMYWDKIRSFFGAAPRNPDPMEDDADDE